MSQNTTIEEKIESGDLNLLVDEMCEDAHTVLEKTRNPQDGVLLRVEGPFGEIGKKNKNGRYYSKKLWDNVLDNKDTKARLKERGCFGEATHPTTFNAEFPRVSHVITDLWVGGKDGQLYGKADVLDTPAGRIVDVLYRANCKVGISSRGAGSTVKRKGREEVNERDFRFSGFDFVTDPSAHNAFPKVAEAYKDEMMDVLTESAAQMMETPESQKYFCELLTTIGCTDKDMLGQCGLQPLTEDMECSCEDEKILEDVSLSPVAKKLQEVREKKKQAEEVPSEVDIKFEAVVLEEANTKIEGLEAELNRTKDQLETSNQRLLKMESDYRDMYLLSQDTTKGEDTEEQSEDLVQKVGNLEADLDDSSKRVADLSEINEDLSRATSTQETQMNDLTEKTEALDLALTESESARNVLQESVKALKEDKSGLQEKVVGLKSQVLKIREDNTELYARYQAAKLRLDEESFVGRIKEIRPHTRAQIREVGKVLQEEVLHRTGSLGPLPSFDRKDIVKVEITEGRDQAKRERLGKIIKHT